MTALTLLFTFQAISIKAVEGESRENFRVPVSGIDWVLVIDNQAYKK